MVFIILPGAQKILFLRSNVPKKSAPMKNLALGTIIALLSIMFTIQNPELVTIKLFFWKVPEVSLAMVLILTWIAGLLVSMLFMGTRSIKHRRKINDLERKVAELEVSAATTNQESKQ
jgi:uncharacterized integral membrane protein